MRAALVEPRPQNVITPEMSAARAPERRPPWGPVAPPSCKSIFRSLALKVRSRFSELPPSDVVKSVHVDYRILRPINRARGDRHHAASQADVEICGFRRKPISLYLGGVVDLEMEAALWMGGPDGLVLCAQRAATGANRNSLSGLWPVERHTHGSTMAACVNLSIGDRTVHDTLLGRWLDHCGDITVDCLGGQAPRSDTHDVYSSPD